MSRVGKKPIEVPSSVQVSVADRLFKAKGPKGELEFEIPENIDLSIDKNIINLNRNNEEKKTRSLHGMSRAMVNNIIEGLSKGISKNLKIEGVGFKVEMKGKNLFLSLGFSHGILFIPPEGIEFLTSSATSITVNGIDKQLVGEVAARIRRFRPLEPYKGKGIRYEGEYIRRKAGKTAAK